MARIPDEVARLRELRDKLQAGSMVSLPAGMAIRPQTTRQQDMHCLQLLRAVAEGQKALLRRQRRDAKQQLRNVASDLPADATGQEAGRREVLQRQLDQISCYLQQTVEEIRQLDDRLERLAAVEVARIRADRDHQRDLEKYVEPLRDFGRQHAERVERELFSALGIPAQIAGGQPGPQPTGGATVFWPDAEPADSPAAAAVCPDCNGTGQYQGLMAVEPCRACCGSEGVPECGD